ncbi:MAG: 5-formyltetrahydrofolate cyclo-ligase [Rhizobiaceae bacterium]|nr:5-formyltetrahydrofolate cyclo-ligase [Rhizobiaceae bacterium]
MQVKDEKHRLRSEALARRDALDPQWRVEASLAIAESLGVIDFEPGTVVSGFLPIRSEVDLRPGMAALRDRGAALCLPAILDTTTIAFRELVRGAEMVPMGFGTFGPGPEAKVLQPDLMLVPLAAFDDRGHRIGYGAGYYDRAIARLREAGKTPRLIAVAFECQRVDLVPDEPHDVPLAEIVTEAGLKTFPR